MWIFKINYLSVTIWVCLFIMIIIVIIAFLWRVLTKPSESKQDNKKIGNLSKNMHDFIISLGYTTNYDILYNILIKNKFAKLGFSLIPAIIFGKSNIYVITDIIESHKFDEIVFSDDFAFPMVIINKKCKWINNVKFKHFKEISKFLNHSFLKQDLHLKTMVLINANKNIIIKNSSSLMAVKLEDIEEVIDKGQDYRDNFKQINKKVIRFLKSKNIYENKTNFISKGEL